MLSRQGDIRIDDQLGDIGQGHTGQVYRAVDIKRVIACAAINDLARCHFTDCSPVQVGQRDQARQVNTRARRIGDRFRVILIGRRGAHHHDHIIAVTGINSVRAFPATNHIGTRATGDRIIARATQNDIRAAAGGDCVIARLTGYCQTRT